MSSSIILRLRVITGTFFFAAAASSAPAAQAPGGSFVERFVALDSARWDWRGSFMLGGHGHDAYMARPDHLGFGPGGLTMRMDEEPCAGNASACCCAGHTHIPCTQDPASQQQTCAQFASGHILSKGSYGYGVYEASIQFSGAEGAISFWDIGEHELCESPHEETQFYYTGGLGEAKTIKTGYYTPKPGVKDGSVGHPLRSNLSFDPSEAFHVYRIEWQQGLLVWSIDGVEIRRATEGVPSPNPGGKGECSKIKFILHPSSSGFSGATQNRVRYLTFNASTAAPAAPSAAGANLAAPAAPMASAWAAARSDSGSGPNSSAELSGGVVTYEQLGGRPYTVGYNERSFTINGINTLLLGGSFHPPRIAYGDWARLLDEAKKDGLNHVQVYVFWNFHERSQGIYDFSAGTRADLAGFFAMAGAAGLFVNVRIGPYVCAEWNGGGFPLWLKHVENFSCARCDDPVWEAEMKGFVVKVASVMEPYLARHGGPIILAQIENELHSGSDDPYVTWCGELAANLQLDIPWVMCNGASAVNTINTCNGNSCGKDGGYADTHSEQFPGQPLGWTEDWSWFNTWGGAVTDHPAPYMAQNIAQWFAKGGSHHNYYMWYGGNHIASWAASGLTNQYGDGSNMHSSTLSNEPKRSHLAAMHRALAAMSAVILGDTIQTRRTAVPLQPCIAEKEGPPYPWRPYGQDVCVTGTNGTGSVTCDARDPTQRWDFSGGEGGKPGTIMQRASSSTSLAEQPMCVSGACSMLHNVPDGAALGCAPLPLVPCDATDTAQQWIWHVNQSSPLDHYMENKASGGCLASWGKNANPGDPSMQPLVGVANCSTGWGSGVLLWTPNASGLLRQGKTGSGVGGRCLSSTHPATSKVLAYEYKHGGSRAAFVHNSGGMANVTHDGVSLSLPGQSISFVLNGKEIFNTNDVATAGVKCNRTYQPLAKQGPWQMWLEPLPFVSEMDGTDTDGTGTVTHSSTPTEQLNLTNDRSDYMYYSASLPPLSSPAAAVAAATLNLTIDSIESNAFLLFLDATFVGSANDHTKGPNHLQLSIPVPTKMLADGDSPRKLLLLSVAMGIQNFHGTNPKLFLKGILGEISLGCTNLSSVAGGWDQRPFLSGELRNAANSSSIPWAPVQSWEKPSRPLTWFKLSFPTGTGRANSTAGVLLLDALGLTRGHFYVNGHDLGRFYTIADNHGELSQRYYYIPEDVLVAPGQVNELVLIDELGATAAPRLVTSRLELPTDSSGCAV